MNMHRFIIAFLCVALCGHAFGQVQDMDKELPSLARLLADQMSTNGIKKVTVLDFTDLQGGSSELGKYIAEELTVNLVMVKKGFSVLDRANLRKILAEHKLTATGLVDPETAKKLGKFAGVDALIIGTLTPKSQKVHLTAKIISTETAEIVDGGTADFKTDETVQQLLSKPTMTEATEDASPSQSSSPPPPVRKPFGDLQAKVESMKLLPGDNVYGFARLTFIITNTSPSKTYGVALEADAYNKFHLSNSRGDDFKATEVSGIETAFDSGGGFSGALTDIPPKTAITIVAKTQVAWRGKPGEYRPYRLQTIVIFGAEENGRYPGIKKYNLVIDIK